MLKVAQRTEFGSRESRRLRRGGFVPGVLYSGGDEARPFQVDERRIRTFPTNGHTLFDLEIDGSKAVPVVVKGSSITRSAATFCTSTASR